MSDDQLSKRERQKLRRERKRETERRAQRRVRARRGMALGVVILLALGAVGWIGWGQLQERQAAAEAEQRAADQLAALGCTPAESEAETGAAAHIPPDQLPANPPEDLYEVRPPSSGPHLGQVAASGVYDVFIDERVLVHNLEHGYVVTWYDENAPVDQVERLKAFAQAQLSDFPKQVVVPWYDAFEGDANFVTVSWGTRQTCQEFSEDVLLTYLNNHHGDKSGAPETFAPTHNPGQQGVLVPEGEPLLFPPLDAE